MYNRTTNIVPGLHIGPFFQQEVHHIIVTILGGYDERGQSVLFETNKVKKPNSHSYRGSADAMHMYEICISTKIRIQYNLTKVNVKK